MLDSPISNLGPSCIGKSVEASYLRPATAEASKGLGRKAVRNLPLCTWLLVFGPKGNIIGAQKLRK